MIMKRIALMILVALMAGSALQAKKMSDLTVVIDPGHGGYDGDDRPIWIYPYTNGSQDGYWESKSNLVKGLHLQAILDSLGVDIHLTRNHNVYNETDGDGIPDEPGLATRAYVANNLGADVFISIHSNAGETVNYPLMIYHAGGKYDDWTGQLTTYKEENKILSEVVNDVFNTSVYSNWIDYRGQINTTTPGRVTSDVALLGYSLGVLRNLHGVGMLSEGGMHEHRPQAHRLMNNDYNWLEAWYFAKALMIYFDTEDRFVTGNIAGVVYDDHNIREWVFPAPHKNNTMLGRDKNLPINGSHVELFDAAGNLVQERITDNDYNGVYVFRNITPGTYTVKVSHDNYYVMEKTVEVVADEVTYQDMPLVYKREEPLKVVSYAPVVAEGELVSCASTIDLTFNWDVDVESFEQGFKLEPAVDGYFKYSNSYRNVSFVPTIAFEKDTEYTLTIPASVKSTDTIYSHPQMESDFVLKFKTVNRNKLAVIDTYPSNGVAVHCIKPSLEFRFDKEVDPNTINGTVIVYDSKGNEIANITQRTCSYNKLSNGYGNLVYKLSSDLTVGENYKAVLSGDLRDKESIPVTDAYEINFTAMDASTVKAGTVEQDFELAALFEYDTLTTKGISNVKPKYAAVTTRLFDKKSGKFSYEFASNREGVVVYKYIGADTVQVVNGDKLGLHVYGDFNNHELYIGFTTGTDTKYEKVCDLNFLGWEYFEIPTSTLEAGYTYELSHIKLVQVTSPITQKGAFQLDNLIKLEGSGVEDILNDNASQVKIYPIPATDVINVDSPVAVQALELVNIQGVSVAKVENASSINVKEQPQGVYILKVFTENGMSSYRVAISK